MPAASIQEQYCRKLLRPAVDEQWPTVGTARTLLLRDNAAPHKASATIQYLEEEKLQVLPHQPYGLQPWFSTMWLLAVFHFENWQSNQLINQSINLTGKKFFCEFKILQERWIHNFMSYPLWNTATPSRNG